MVPGRGRPRVPGRARAPRGPGACASRPRPTLVPFGDPSMIRRGSPDFFAIIARELYTAVLSDVLDELGCPGAGAAAVDPAARRRADDGRRRAHGALSRDLRGAGGREPVRTRDRAGRRPEASRRRGVRLRRLHADRAVGRAAVDGGEGARRGRVPDRRLRARHPPDPADGLPGVPRRHRAARLEGPRQGRRDRRADRMRRRARCCRATSSSATPTASSSCRRPSRRTRSTARSRRCAARTARARNSQRGAKLADVFARHGIL